MIQTTTITKKNFYLIEMLQDKDTKLIELTTVKIINNKMYKYIKADLTLEQTFTHLHKFSTIDDELYKTIATITKDSLVDKLNTIISNILRECTELHISITNSTVYQIVNNTYYALNSEHQKLFLDDYSKYIDIQEI